MSQENLVEALFVENPALRDSPIIRELLAENQRQVEEYAQLLESQKHWRKLAERFNAENQRLRDALGDWLDAEESDDDAISDLVCAFPPPDAAKRQEETRAAADKARDCARAALAGTPTKEE